MFAVPFDEIARVVDRSPQAARQLASRARRRVQAENTVPDPDLDAQREVVEAFLAAARNGDFDALLELLDPDVVLRADGGTLRAGASVEVRGAAPVANRALAFTRLGVEARPVLVNGAVGAVSTLDGNLFAIGGYTVSGGRIVAMDILADPERLSRLDLTILDG
jgi:ketosteroid isomerase-like protein